VFSHGRVLEHDDRAALAARAGSHYRRLLELALELDEPPVAGVDDLEPVAAPVEVPA
jgi:hypothetical protein